MCLTEDFFFIRSLINSISQFCWCNTCQHIVTGSIDVGAGGVGDNRITIGVISYQSFMTRRQRLSVPGNSHITRAH